MTNKFFLFLFFYSLTSCNQKESSSKKAVFKDSIKTSNSKKTKVVNEDFFIFLRDFSFRKKFQKERIKFPLQDCYLSEDNNIICNYIKSEKWIYVTLLDTTNTISLVYDNFKKEFRDTDERVYAIQGIENDISNYYYFKRINGNWYLIKREDFSY